MLTGLRLKNFRSISDSGELRLANLTFLLGPNSSGKTSLIHALRVARQTVDSRDQQVSLVLQGSYVDLGTYSDLAYQHDTNLPLNIEFSWHQPTTNIFRIGANRIANEFDLSRLMISTEFQYNRKTWETYPVLQEITNANGDFVAKKVRWNKRYSRFSLQINDNDQEPLAFTMPTGGKFYSLDLTAARLSDIRRHPSSELALWLFYSFAFDFERQMEKMFFLGPVRGETNRTYSGGVESPQDVGLRGETTAGALWWASRRAETRRTVLNSVNKWLQKLGVAREVSVQRIQATDFRLNVKDVETGIESNITDVGFGISQVLPVIVLPCMLGSDPTIIIEQPEIHLHPAAQLELGDFFVEMARGGKQFVIETHSEHIIRRVQTLVATGKITSDEIAIYYIEESKRGTRIRELPITDKGALENLPKGFFEHSATEAFRRVMTTVRG